MSDPIIKTARDAQIEIAQIVLNRSLEGKINWLPMDQEFAALVAEGIRATLDISGGNLVDSTNWDNFRVSQEGDLLVNFFYPSPRNQISGVTIVPNQIKTQVDQLFSLLRGELVQKTYGPSLERLRSLR